LKAFSLNRELKVDRLQYPICSFRPDLFIQHGKESHLFVYLKTVFGMLVTQPPHQKSIGKFPKFWKWPRRSHLPRYFPVWLSLILGIGVSGAAGAMVWHWEMGQFQQQFPRWANNLTLALQQTLDEHLQVNQAVAALYDSTDRVALSEFTHFSQVFLPQYPAIQELGWVVRVGSERREDFEHTWQLQGDPQFRIQEYRGQELVPAAQRAEYYPTVYSQVRLPRKAVLGFDRATLPQSSALKRAQLLGVTTATARFILNERQAVFEVYHPIERQGQADSFVYTTYDLQELLAASIRALNQENLDFYLYDIPIDQLDVALSTESGAEADRFLLYYNTKKHRSIDILAKAKPPNKGKNYCPYSNCIRTLNVANREWSILVVPHSPIREIGTHVGITLLIGLLSTSTLAFYLWNNTRRTLETEALNRRLSAEVQVARRLQQMLLPKEHELDTIPGLDIAGFMEPADEIGGDYYDVLTHNGRIAIGIGDVTGHGLESGVLMLMVQTAVRTLLVNNETDSKRFLDAINQVIYGNLQRMDSHRNMTFSLLDYCDGKLRLCGQHEEAIVVRQGGRVERIDTLDLGFPLGLEKNISQFVEDAFIELNLGDVVVLYTDGITEAENSEGRLYGVDRLCQVVGNLWQLSAREIRQAAIADLKQHIGTQKIFDDMTLLVLKTTR
jgi:serine phosphatase RsbU (regulator of sigma subunit)/CHASE1-domain containing sensor protein